MKYYNQGLSYALRLISKKRYTESQITRKLCVYFEKKIEKEDDPSKIDPQELIEEIIKRLKELNYINDSQYISDYIEQRMKLRPRGLILIKNELIKKGVSKEEINQFLQLNEIDEENAAIECLLKKDRSWNKYSFFEKKKKAFQYLKSRGFNFNTINNAVSSVYKNFQF